MKTEEYLRDFGQRVREIRVALEVSQEELAQRIGYTSRSSICKIENGQRDLALSSVQKIAAALGVSASVICSGSGKQVVGKKLQPVDADPYAEYLPYLHKADKSTLDAVRKLLDMPPKKNAVVEGVG